MSVFFRSRPQPQPTARPLVRGTGVRWPDHLLTGSNYASVDLSTPESLLQSIAVGSAADLVASLVSELPVDVYSGTGSERRRRSTPAYLLDPAGDGYGLEDWTYQGMMSWLLRGNLYGDILATANGAYPTQVAWQHPDEVRGDLDSNGAVKWSINGRPVPDGRLWHRRVNPVTGRVLGLSVVQHHAAQIGLSLTAGQFGLQWFQDGGHPSALLTNEEVELDKDRADTAKARFLAALRGSREPLVMGKGWKYQAIQVSPEESQFLATQKYSEAQCARLFGPGIAEVLGYESGATMTYTNVNDRDLHLLKYALSKWLRRWDRLLSAMLPRPQYVRLNRDALLETSTLQRYQAHASALQNQWKVPNEVREVEDLPPVPWGDAPMSKTSAPAAPAEPQPGGN